MPEYSELEVSLYRQDAESYGIELRFSRPDDQAVRAPHRGSLQIQIQDLKEFGLDPEKYGLALSASLFQDQTVRDEWVNAFTATEADDRTLRIRLHIDRSAPELHNIRWETLRDPRDDSWLLTNEQVLFSRFLQTTDWRPVRLRPKGDLRALVAIANPSDLADPERPFEVSGRKLLPVDVDSELSRARESLGTIEMTALATDPANPGMVTLTNLIASLREGYDILYLVCHGAIIQKETPQPYLWLESEDGTSSVTSGADLIQQLQDLARRPYLVVLASCQSAGDGGELRASDPTGALAALGPQLAQMGIPAVMAMQGDITMETIAKLMPKFFTELQEDGQIDRAMTVARGTVRERFDSWMPALYLRLRGGRIWYVPGFGEERREFEKWPAVVRNINRGRSTPILGPGLYESLLGSPHEIARRWAERYHYPMETHERDSLPQVAQYLTVSQYERAPYDELEEYLRQEVNRRFGELIADESQSAADSLDQLIDRVGKARRERNQNNPYKVLAQLPLPVYITTNLNNLLSSALREAGKDPQVVLCPWNDYVEQIESIYDIDPDYQPTVEKPLVYHLFGRMDEPDSIVLTEDDYFDFLIGVTRNQDLIPKVVNRSLVDSALLFLGFQMDDWQFRVLFRSILAQQGGHRRGKYPHIAVQIEPEEGRILEPDRARRYLENLYFQGAKISLYWGSVEDFIRDLQENVKPFS